MSIRLILSLVLGSCAAVAGAQTTIQQQFEAGSAAMRGERWPEALQAFEALEARLVSEGRGRNLGLAKLRRGQVLVHLGRQEEADQALRDGLSMIPADDASLREERALGLIVLGELQEARLHYGIALNSFRAAREIAGISAAAQLRALRGIGQTSLLLDRPQALKAAREGLRLAQEQPDKELHAVFQTLEGRALLSMGQLAEANASFASAISLLGGVTRTVDLSDLQVRQDAALAGLLSGRYSEAYQLLAYSGAGSYRGRSWLSPRESYRIRCSPGEGVPGRDLSVVEFTLKEDGTVAAVRPVYASREGEMAFEFAHSLKLWTWPAAEAAKLPPLLRSSVRIGFRCGPSLPSTTELLKEEFREWLKSRGIGYPEPESYSPVGRLEWLKEQLKRVTPVGSPDQLRALPVLYELANSRGLQPESSLAYSVRALALARSEGAPSTIIFLMLLDVLIGQQAVRSPVEDLNAAGLENLASSPEVQKDPRAMAALRAIQLEVTNPLKEPAQARKYATQVADAKGLSPADPLRVYPAYVMSLAKGATEADRRSALATFAAAGQPLPCALARQKALLSTRAPRPYPTAAQRLGIEGWTGLYFDIDASGRPTNLIPFASFPPLIFDQAAIDHVSKFRYRSRQPCVRENLFIRFRVQ